MHTVLSESFPFHQFHSSNFCQRSCHAASLRNEHYSSYLVFKFGIITCYQAGIDLYRIVHRQ